MKTTDSIEDVEIESGAIRAARLTFLASLGFWPIFLFATSTMLGPVGSTAAAMMRRNILVYSTWFYPLAVILAWLLAKHGLRRGRPDAVCLLPWLLPTAICAYWLGYFLL
jgi:uncharacterized membrane protein YhaH (DUF805 family)